MSIEQKLYEVKIFQLPIHVDCDKINQSKVCNDFAFKNSHISCLALVFNLKNQSMTVLYAKNQLQVAKYDKSYTISFW